MKIHGLCLTKNEADVIELFLRKSLEWCDYIYVYDNGSSDNTWGIVRDFSDNEPRIIPYTTDDRPFDNALRAELFSAYRKKAARGDWWCRLDTDEFYADDPQAFLKKVPASSQVVWAAHCQYYLTMEDVERLGSAAEATAPVMTWESLPHYYLSNSSEARFFRHRPGLVWNTGAWPLHVGLIYPKRIRLRHFQFRSPAQIQRRLDTRHDAIKAGNPDFPHNVARDWREVLAKRKDLYYDDLISPPKIDERTLPRFLEPAPQRLIKRVCHGLGIWP